MIYSKLKINGIGACNNTIKGTLKILGIKVQALFLAPYSSTLKLLSSLFAIIMDEEQFKLSLTRQINYPVPYRTVPYRTTDSDKEPRHKAGRTRSSILLFLAVSG